MEEQTRDIPTEAADDLLPKAVFLKKESWWKFWLWFKKKARVAFINPSKKTDSILPKLEPQKIQQRNRHIDIVLIEAIPIQYFVWSEDKNNLAGYCLVTVNEKQASIIGAPPIRGVAIWHIHVDPKYRRQGYAGTLLIALKHSFSTIFTEALSDESRCLLRKHGFNKEGKYYYWRRPKEFDGTK
jgi:ribosomal protein S18 acetylase RimI-like enzyme